MALPGNLAEQKAINAMSDATTAAEVRRIVSKYRGNADSKRVVKKFGRRMLQHLQGKKSKTRKRK